MVSKDLDCKTYKKDATKQLLKEENIFEAGADFSAYTPSTVGKISCNANKCLFNKKGECTANGISVLSGRKSGFCATNIDK